MPRLARFLAWMSAAALGIAALVVTPACAQTEFAPAAGKGRLVVVLSGNDGASRYIGLAGQIAQLGYDVVLLDGNNFCCRQGDALHAAIVTAQRSEHALPGKVAVVGFSVGGGDALAWPTQWPDLVATVVAWYPGTRFIKDPDVYVSRVKLPVLILAGGHDNQVGCCWEENPDEMRSDYGCCWVERVQAVAAAAAARNIPLELVTYPDVHHGFVRVDDAKRYDGRAANDAWRRQASWLKKAFDD